MEFEWDEAKAKSNYAKHGVRFEFAQEAFKDSFAIDSVDKEHGTGEERFILVGMAKETLLYIVYSEPNGRTRIISARKATRNEEQEYFEENS